MVRAAALQSREHLFPKLEFRPATHDVRSFRPPRRLGLVSMSVHDRHLATRPGNIGCMIRNQPLEHPAPARSDLSQRGAARVCVGFPRQVRTSDAGSRGCNLMLMGCHFAILCKRSKGVPATRLSYDRRDGYRRKHAGRLKHDSAPDRPALHHS